MGGNTQEDSVINRQMIRELAVEYDRDKMAAVIDRIPDQIEIGLSHPMPAIPQGPFNKVTLVGMGGSALAMDIVIDAFAGQLKAIPTVTRDYALPASVDGKTLVIASSFSGRTEEVLSAIESLPKEALNIVVISREGGNDLSAMAHQRGYPAIGIPVSQEPEGFQPRSAVGYVVALLARLLGGAGVMDDPIPLLKPIPQFLRKSDIRPEAEDAAMWLADKIPIVYTDEAHLNSVARITKIKFNENSKRPAFFNALPEANHNEMIGFTTDIGLFGVLYLHDPASHPRIRHRFRVMRQVFERAALNHVSFREWQMLGTTNLQKVFSALVYADWCSYTLALLDRRNPTPVDLVEDFKKALGPRQTAD